MARKVAASKLKDLLEDNRRDALLMVWGAWLKNGEEACNALKELMEEFSDKEFWQAEILETRDIAKEYQIEHVPTFIFFKKQEIWNKVYTYRGDSTKKYLQDLLQRM
ncbi:uncharacterized protein [Ptychodera flava]|uniref:uncharacterized protein n=1 Tax=Ptychodera flava TaxID=63121 RepID=UPI003969BDD1